MDEHFFSFSDPAERWNGEDLPWTSSYLFNAISIQYTEDSFTVFLYEFNYFVEKQGFANKRRR